MRKWFKQFLCLMITAHSEAVIVSGPTPASIIESGTWDMPTTAECQRCGATVSFI